MHLMAMDKKSKKRVEVIKQKLQKLQLQLNGAKQQNDEPGEVERIEQEIQTLKEELAALKKG